jgi:hypothetical protein
VVAAAGHRQIDAIAQHLAQQRVGPARRRGDQITRAELRAHETCGGDPVLAIWYARARRGVRGDLAQRERQQRDPRSTGREPLHGGGE